MPKTLVCTSSIAMRLCAVIVTCECQRHVNERAQPNACTPLRMRQPARCRRLRTFLCIYIHTQPKLPLRKRKRIPSFSFFHTKNSLQWETYQVT